MRKRITIDFYLGFDHPEEDGLYTVITNDQRIWTMHFTVKHGWNTTEHFTDNRYEDDQIYAWSPNLYDQWLDSVPPAYECMDCGHKFMELDEKLETYVDNHGGEDIVWSEKVQCCPKCGSTEWKEWGV